MIVKNADEAARILVELMQTEQLVSLHFEYDIAVDEVPRVRYTVNRFAIKNKDGDGDGV